MQRRENHSELPGRSWLQSPHEVSLGYFLRGLSIYPSSLAGAGAMADMMAVVGPPIEIHWLEGAPQVAPPDLN